METYMPLNPLLEKAGYEGNTRIWMHLNMGRKPFGLKRYEYTKEYNLGRKFFIYYVPVRVYECICVYFNTYIGVETIQLEKIMMLCGFPPRIESPYPYLWLTAFGNELNSNVCPRLRAVIQSMKEINEGLWRKEGFDLCKPAKVSDITHLPVNIAYEIVRNKV